MTCGASCISLGSGAGWIPNSGRCDFTDAQVFQVTVTIATVYLYSAIVHLRSQRYKV